jgi:hypothetical protein
MAQPLPKTAVIDFAIQHEGQIVAYAFRQIRKDGSVSDLEWRSGILRRDPKSSADEFDLEVSPETDLPTATATRNAGVYAFPHPMAHYFTLMTEQQFMREAGRASVTRMARLEAEVAQLKAALAKATTSRGEATSAPKKAKAKKA